MIREEILKNLNNLHYKILHHSFCNRVREAEIQALVMAKKLLEQPQADKWIPCEERLPDKHKQVLGYLIDGYIHICIRGDGYWYKDTGLPLGDKVIAWQPLPAPYKKEGAENGQI